MVPIRKMTILILCLASIAYSQELICSNRNNLTSNQLDVVLPILWSQVRLQSIDRYQFLILCPIVFIFQVLIIILYLKSRSLFKKPGDIFFGNIIASCLLNYHLLSTAIYYTIYPQSDSMPSSFVNFCFANSFIQSFASIVQIGYIFFFLSYVIVTLKTSLNHKSKLLGWYMHLIIIMFALILCIVVWRLKLFGLSSLGLCELTAARNNSLALGFTTTGILLSVLFIIIGLYSWCYFRRHIPKRNGLMNKRYKQIKVISIYIGGYSIFLIMYCVSSLSLYINCYKDGNFLIPLDSQIFNFFRVFECIFLISLLFANTQIRVRFLKMIRKFIQRQFYSDTGDADDLDHYREDSQLDDSWLDDKMIELKQQKNKIDLMKVAQILTILTGVRIANKQYMSNVAQVDKIRQNVKLKKIYYRQEVTFEIQPDIVKQFEIQTQLLPKFSILSGSVTIFAPKIFLKIIQDDELQNIYESFNIINNYQKLMSHLIEGQGGRSGQFFYYTADHKYILKTINSEQYTFFTENLQKFVNYFINNPSSLITKIYGIYTIKNKQSQVSHSVILMRNLSSCPKKKILRTYDLKGSIYKRKVLRPNKQYSQTQLRKITLKDIDFLELEQSIHISSESAQNLRQTIRKDTLFLQSMNLIDYSLLIFKISTKYQTRQHRSNLQLSKKTSQEFQEMSQIDKDQSEQLMKRKQSSVKSNKIMKLQSMYGQYYYYRIGVIDYMQKWDLQKKGQKWWKNLIGKKQVSAQEPNRYQQRFMQFVDKITLYSIENYEIASSNIPKQSRDQNN